MALWLSARPASVPPVHLEQGIAAFFAHTQDPKRASPKKEDCNGCGAKKKIEPKPNNAPSIIPASEALFTITNRRRNWTPSGDDKEPVSVDVEQPLTGRFIYWCGPPVGKVEGRWEWRDSRFTITRIDADKKTATIVDLRSMNERSRKDRCVAAYERMGTLLSSLPKVIEPKATHAGYRAITQNTARVVLVATDPKSPLFDDIILCVDHTNHPIQFELTRAHLAMRSMDAEHLVCFVDAEVGNTDVR